MNALTLIGTIILWVLAAVGTISVFLMAHGARKYNRQVLDKFREQHPEYFGDEPSPVPELEEAVNRICELPMEDWRRPLVHQQMIIQDRSRRVVWVGVTDARRRFAHRLRLYDEQLNNWMLQLKHILNR